jgi:serine/threonine protein kinase
VLKGVKLDKRVDFSNEELYFCYADIAPHNFLITNGNQLCVIDFGHAAFLPAAFMSFILHSPSGSSFAFVEQISSRMQFLKSGNLDAMNWVAYHFGVRGRSSFG